MWKLITSRALAAMMMMMVCWQAAAQETEESKFKTSAGMSYMSRYVWRGQQLNDDPVLQPTITMAYDKLSLNIWGNLNMRDFIGNDDEAWKVQEIDWTLDYTFDLSESLSLGLGVIRYDFPGTGLKSTTELYGRLDFAALPLTPYIVVYGDVDEAGSLYARTGISKGFALNDCLTATGGAVLGWGNNRYHKFYLGGLDEASASDLEISVSLDWAVSDDLTLSLLASYTNFLTSKTRDAAGAAYGDHDVYVTGVKVAFNF